MRIIWQESTSCDRLVQLLHPRKGFGMGLGIFGIVWTCLGPSRFKALADQHGHYEHPPHNELLE